MNIMMWPKVKKQLELLFNVSGLQQTALQPLAGGYSDATNFTYVTPEQKTYLVRLFPQELALEYRQREIKSSCLAADLGVAPKVRYKDDDFMIIDYIDSSRMMGAEDYKDINALNSIAQRLKILHAAKATEIDPGKDLYRGYQYYCRRADPMQLPKAFGSLSEWMKSNFEEVSVWNKTPCFVHNDLNRENMLLKGDALYIIDWTDAGVGDPYVDLAEVAIFLDEDLKTQFLESYLGCAPKALEVVRLDKHIELRYGLFAAWGLEQAAKVYQDEAMEEAWQAALDSTQFANAKTMLGALLKGEWSVKVGDKAETFKHYLIFSSVMFKDIKIATERLYECHRAAGRHWSAK